MALSGAAANKAVFTGLFILTAVLILWGGFTTINYVLVSRFHKDFLVGWEETLRAYGRENGPWPAFKDDEHAEFMDALVESLRRRGFPPPRSNTKRPYVYRIKKVGPPYEDAFILCLPDRIVVYGISGTTFNQLDKLIDGRVDPRRGFFTGQEESAAGQITAVWRL